MLISISGRAGVGKDTVGKIIQYLTSKLSHEPFKLEELVENVKQILIKLELL